MNNTPKGFKLTSQDVFGKYNAKFRKRIHNGMIVADCRTGGYNRRTGQSKGVCPVFGDNLSFKSNTLICEPHQATEVEYLIELSKGKPYTKKKVLVDGRIAYRADYHND